LSLGPLVELTQNDPVAFSALSKTFVTFWITKQ